jgi:2-polyprenyl-3-methyl-5-hydroxy-6-metoxy-1,4-benzoquinol methylase
MAAPDRERSFLLIPAAGAGEGMGHLVRCVKLADKLGPRVSFLTRHMDTAATELLAELQGRRPKERKFPALRELPAGRRWDMILVDARGISATELWDLAGHGLVVCLDEGGEARGHASFTVDTLPGLPGRSAANLEDSGYLFLPRRARREPPKAWNRILVSIGGEDRAQLAGRLVSALVTDAVLKPSQIAVVEGPLSKRAAWPEGVKVVRAPAGLAPILVRHDLLITHFGMSAFEALAVGIPAVLLNPSRYHSRLSAAAGFPTIGTGRPRTAALRRLLAEPARLQRMVQSFNESVGSDRGKKLPRLLRSLSRQGTAECPACGRAGNPVIARFPDRTYRHCAGCGIVSMESFAARPKDYGARYFSSEYKAQYGRTYLQDFESIRAASRPRVDLIRRLLGPGPGGTVLDVGCAYGPFLAALLEAGLAGFGLDISPAAVSHVRRKLGLPALCAGFEKVERKNLPARISALTLWYVLEHFTCVHAVLSKSAALLEKDGVLAFSTPNGRGVSAKTNLGEFLRKSPSDHFTVLSPRGLGSLLARHGFQLRVVRVTGHHPERFPGLLGAAARKWRPAARVLRAVSVLFRLGDTFEAYAVKGEA